MSVAGPRTRAFGVHDLVQFSARLHALRQEVEVPTTPGDYVAHTDGACFSNPAGPGGWAAVVHAPDHPVPALLWGHLSSTTNNRAEALGVLGALEWIPPGSRLAVHSDSELTVRVLQGRYKSKANPDIWEVIRAIIASKALTVTPEWVRGHAGDPLNELADRLSKLGAKDASSLDGLDTPVVDMAPAAAKTAPVELLGLEPRGTWERDFLDSIAKQLGGGRALSPKQRAVIERIRARGGDASALTD